MVVTPHLDVPISRKGLLKTVKHMNYDKLRIRGEKLLQDVGIDFRFGQNPKGFTAKNKQAFLITDSDTMLVTFCSKRFRSTTRASSRLRACR